MSYAKAIHYFGLAARAGFARAAEKVQIVKAEAQQRSPLLFKRVVLRGLKTNTMNGTRGAAVDSGCG